MSQAIKRIILELEKRFDEQSYQDNCEFEYEYESESEAETDDDSSSDYEPGSDTDSEETNSEDEADKCMNDMCNNIVYGKQKCCPSCNCNFGNGAEPE